MNNPRPKLPFAPRALASVFVALLLAGCIKIPEVLTLTLGPRGLELEKITVAEQPSARGEVALIDVSGIILETTAPSALGYNANPVDALVRRLRLAANDPAVKAVVLRVNSPGGGVGASETMYREIRSFRESSGKPVVAVMGDVAASGGYYVSLAADTIVAPRSTVTGSIGVIVPTLNASDGLGRIGIVSRAVTSGPNKDIANPLEPIDEGHYQILQGIVDDFYDDFVARVRERRPMIEPSDLPTYTDGRVVSGIEAVRVGLADVNGTLGDAHDLANQLAGLTASDLVRYAPGALRVETPYASVQSGQASTSATGNPAIDTLARALGSSVSLQPGVYYLWVPPMGPAF